MVIEDEILLEIIIEYCDNIQSAIKRFSIDANTVTEDPDMRALLAFFVQQIGEVSIKLSDKFKKEHSEIEWKSISGLRHRIVHAYGQIIPEILWDTVQNNIPDFRTFCAKQIGKS